MITGVTGTTTSTSGADAMKKATGMNKDDFLQLFVTQLQNQDPLNPQDGTQFLGQLAQLTQVEQAYNTNSNLQSLLTAQSNQLSLSAVSFIGKDVLAKGSQLPMTAGAQTTVNYSLPQAVDQVSVVITDAAGRTVRTLTGGASAAGQSSVAWDGKDAGGQPVSAGTYRFSVTGTAAGQSVTGTPLMLGRVDSVRVDGTTPVLTMNGCDVTLDSVLQVKGV